MAKENNRKEWFQIVEEVTPYIVRVVTPKGHGTGFLLANSTNGELVGVATAFHVISEAFEWDLPIRIEHFSTGKMSLLQSNNRHIEVNPRLDTAVIIFERGELPLPKKDLALMPEKKNMKVGCDIGWLGFPGIVPRELCFFSGHVSSWNDKEHRYLVDGVAINGVSGGPVLRPRFTGEVHLVGTISAYIPNVSTGTSMPGVSVVQDVSAFYSTVKKLKELPPPEAKVPVEAPTAVKQTEQQKS